MLGLFACSFREGQTPQGNKNATKVPGRTPQPFVNPSQTFVYSLHGAKKALPAPWMQETGNRW